MKIDGRILAREVLKRLKADIVSRKKHGKPQLAVVWIGNDPSSASFIKQKQLAAKYIGAQIKLIHFEKPTNYTEISCCLSSIVGDPDIHGIIIQRPLPPSLSAESLNKRIPIYKDVDGFLPKTKFNSPVGIAVFKILAEIYYQHLAKIKKPDEDLPKSLISWLKNKNIVLLGKGETAGIPIARIIHEFKLNLIILNSQSENRSEYLQQADIVISAVGKSNVISYDQLKPQVILIGVGLHSEKHHLIGDYDEKDIKQITSFYTPTPGGVGPVNVASLMQNLVTAHKQQTK